MARKQRCRWIDGYPEYWFFRPEEGDSAESVVMSLDEFETVRLLDREGLTQEQCAQRMGVSRTTVTAIYDSARKKLAEALVDGRGLRLGGGSYRLTDQGTEHIMQKGNMDMRIAVTYENGEIHGALAGFLKAAQVDALICGGIGMGAQNALREAGIRLYAGVVGSADAAAQALAADRLSYDPDAHCDHHHEGDHDCGHHHEGDHDCGHHHEGGYDCGHHHGDEGCLSHHQNDGCGQHRCGR